MRQARAVRAPFRRSRVAVTATFAVHAVVAGSLGPWIPALKASSALDAAGLGLALSGFAVGLVTGTRVAGPSVRRAGGRNVVRAGVPLLAAAFALLPVARGLAALAVAFAGLGLVGGLLDVAMNAEAVEVERRYGRRVMSAMHGTWSVSMLGGAALASASVAARIPIGVHFSVTAALLVAASFPLLRWLPSPHEARSEFETGPRAGRARSPAIRVALLCLIAFAAFMTEGIASEWSAVYLNEAVGATFGIAGLGVVAFSAGMAASRFAVDRIPERVEPSTVVRVGEVVGGIALGTALLAGGAILSIVALAVLGLGVGPAVPLAFRAAGGIDVERGRTALGVVVTAGYVGSILGPLAVGFTAHQAGLRAAFTIPVIACVAVALVAGALSWSGARR